MASVIRGSDNFDTNTTGVPTEFIATANQTTFTCTYSVGSVDVHVNGALIPTARYTASNGTSIVLDTGVPVGAKVTVLSYVSLSLVDTYNRSQVYTKTEAYSKTEVDTAVAGASDLVHLSTQTASNSASVAFDNTLITNTYNDYILVLQNVVPTTNAVHPDMYLSADNGSTMVGNIKTGRHYMQLGGAGAGHEGSNGTYMRFGYNVSNVADQGGSAQIFLPNLRSSVYYKFGHFMFAANHNGSEYAWHGGFKAPANSAINYIKFQYHSGTIASGSLSLYGVKS